MMVQRLQFMPKRFASMATHLEQTKLPRLLRKLSLVRESPYNASDLWDIRGIPPLGLKSPHGDSSHFFRCSAFLQPCHGRSCRKHSQNRCARNPWNYGPCTTSSGKMADIFNRGAMRAAREAEGNDSCLAKRTGGHHCSRIWQTAC